MFPHPLHQENYKPLPTDFWTKFLLVFAFFYGAALVDTISTDLVDGSAKDKAFFLDIGAVSAVIPWPTVQVLMKQTKELIDGTTTEE